MLNLDRELQFLARFISKDGHSIELNILIKSAIELNTLWMLIPHFSITADFCAAESDLASK